MKNVKVKSNLILIFTLSLFLSCKKTPATQSVPPNAAQMSPDFAV